MRELKRKEIKQVHGGTSAAQELIDRWRRRYGTTDPVPNLPGIPGS